MSKVPGHVWLKFMTRWLRVSFSYKKLGYALAMFAVAGLRFESRVSLVWFLDQMDIVVEFLRYRNPK